MRLSSTRFFLLHHHRCSLPLFLSVFLSLLSLCTSNSEIYCLQPKDEDVPFNVSRQDIELETGSSATSGDEDDDGEGETQKLTRAQRKRMRKKKLKEDASRRKQIIGPLLPSKIDEGENCTPDARRNASEEPSETLNYIFS